MKVMQMLSAFTVVTVMRCIRNCQKLTDGFSALNACDGPTKLELVATKKATTLYANHVFIEICEMCSW